MKTTNLLLVIAFLTTATVLHAGSLRDGERARTLTVGEQALFGPKSARLRYDPRMIRAAELARQRAAVERHVSLPKPAGEKPAPARIAAN